MGESAYITEVLDSNWMEALMIRWKLAEQFVQEIPGAQETGKMALQVLISRDFPILIQEVLRLRPELADQPENRVRD